MKIFDHFSDIDDQIVNFFMWQMIQDCEQWDLFCFDSRDLSHSGCMGIVDPKLICM